MTDLTTTALFIGLANLAIGAAYVSMGLLSAWEALSQYKHRGLSRFGLGFSLMAASCGPHHLVHGWCVLQGGAITAPMLAITVVGLPAGITFCLLRAEAMLGRRGDRVMVAPARLMVSGALLWLGAVGVLAGWAATAASPVGQDICSALGLGPSVGGVQAGTLVWASNLFVAATYAMVGWYLVETQVRRYVAQRTWSLSGLSLAAVFPTCAAMHLILALTRSADSATLPFDLLGVPASVYFLWVVRQLHTESVDDWNRGPLAGVADTPRRAAPWSNLPISPR